MPTVLNSTNSIYTSPAIGLLPVTLFAAPNADFTLANSVGVQTLFPPSCDIWTLAANTTYWMRGIYILTTGGAGHTTAMAFLLGGGATVTNFEYVTMTWTGAVNTVQAAQAAKRHTGVASSLLNASAAAAEMAIDFKGFIRTGTAGTMTPQINFSVAPGGTNLLKRGSFITFVPMGSDTVEKEGSVG